MEPIGPQYLSDLIELIILIILFFLPHINQNRSYYISLYAHFFFLRHRQGPKHLRPAMLVWPVFGIPAIWFLVPHLCVRLLNLDLNNFSQSDTLAICVHIIQDKCLASIKITLTEHYRIVRMTRRSNSARISPLTASVAG